MAFPAFVERHYSHLRDYGSRGVNRCIQEVKTALRLYLQWWDLLESIGEKLAVQYLAFAVIGSRQKTVSNFNRIQSRFAPFLTDTRPRE